MTYNVKMDTFMDHNHQTQLLKSVHGCVTKHLNYDSIPADKRSVFPVEGDEEHRNVCFVHNSIFCCIKTNETPDNKNTTNKPDDKHTN